MSLTEDLPLDEYGGCVCVYNTSMTDIVVEKMNSTHSCLDLNIYLQGRTHIGWYTIHISIWAELCVTGPSGKGKLSPYFFRGI